MSEDGAVRVTRRRLGKTAREAEKFIFLFEELIIDGHLDHVDKRFATRIDKALDRLRRAIAEEQAG